MLKPEEIKNEQFELSVLGGYKREQVDEFFAVVCQDYQKLFDEKAELIEKLKLCVQKIEEYQKDEQFLKTAIINAEKLNETSLREIERREREIETAAREKAELIVKNAELEAENIMSKVKKESETQIKECELSTAKKIAEFKQMQDVEEQNLVNLKKEVSDFKEMLLKLYEEHLSSITKLPDYKQKETEIVEPETVEQEIEQPVVEVAEEPVQQAVEEEAPEVTSNTIIVENVVSQAVETPVNQSEKTTEFVIEKTTNPTVDQDAFERNFKFKDLKFGTDFDITNEK